MFEQNNFSYYIPRELKCPVKSGDEPSLAICKKPFIFLLLPSKFPTVQFIYARAIRRFSFLNLPNLSKNKRRPSPLLRVKDAFVY